MGYSGAGGKLIHEKNQKQKISWHCPFKSFISFLSPISSQIIGVSSISCPRVQIKVHNWMRWKAVAAVAYFMVTWGSLLGNVLKLLRSEITVMGIERHLCFCFILSRTMFWSPCGLIRPLRDCILFILQKEKVWGSRFQWPVKDMTGDLRWWASQG